MAAHILGYLQEIDRWRLTKLEDYGYKTKDIVGFGGLEERFDYYLRQEAGGVSVEIDHRGRLVRLLGFRQPVNGKDLQLTLDLRLQKITEQKLSDKKGCVIIMQPFTGEVLALASSPGFNPATFVEKDKSSIREIFRHPDSPLFNRATSGSYPPGSIFKVIVATAALETKRLDLSKTFFCQGDIFIGKQKFHCWETHYSQNLIQAIAHSCNIFFYKAGILVGPQTICDYALKFGFAHLIPFELPYQESGFLPSPLWKRMNKFGKWFPGDTANLSIGQGEVLVTPLQVTRMMAVFANRGYLVNPYIVKSVAGTPTILYKTKALNLSLREGTLNYIRQGLRDAVLDLKGTANVLAGLLVAVAGKTGTAQTSGGPPHAWFAGFFPFRAPRYVICVFLEQGGAGYQAALVAKQIIEAMLAEGLT
jgi:penicillin-binding protein 2